ncbi:MAG TPA: thiamine phosphate synthase [Vicinamibacterales bacterium]|nr:thiamine phosphate synthase [Vicinamibacterales bacterium]
MTICLVTDRRRRSPVEQAAEAADAGVDLIQIREPDMEAAALASLVARIVGITHGSRTRVVVNERLDVALTCGADGVHLRGDSMPPFRVRPIVPSGFLIGRSVHERSETTIAARDVNYFIAGTVFPTASKPGKTDLLGQSGLAAIASATPVPVLAIGGITMETVGAVASTGAAGIAAIGLFADRDRPIKQVVRALQERFNIGGVSSSST